MTPASTFPVRPPRDSSASTQEAALPFQSTPISDPADPRVEPFLQVRERDLVGRRVGRLAELIGDQALDAPVYVAEQAVMDAIVGFPIHRGLLGVGRRRAAPEPEDLLTTLGREALVAVVHGIGNHDNMGGLFRNAAAFGVDAVLLDATSCDPLYRKAIRVSVGAVLITPFARLASEADLLSLLIAQGFEAVALTPSGTQDLATYAPAAKTAVLFGAEGPGLPSELLRGCKTVRIPMAGGFDSLNVATTSGIVLHHLRNA